MKTIQTVSALLLALICCILTVLSVWHIGLTLDSGDAAPYGLTYIVFGTATILFGMAFVRLLAR